MRQGVIGVLAVAISAIAWAEAGPPITVSPGSSSGALTADVCPTFSWSAVEGARAYELVVYRLGARRRAVPVLVHEIGGSALSWTPDLERCLEPGGSYAWSVRAKTGDGLSAWSEPLLFRLEAEPSEAELERALAVVQRYLNARGATEGDGVGSAVEGRAPEAGGTPGSVPEPAALGSSDFSVDASGNVEGLSFAGDGSALTNVTASDLVAGAVVSESELDFDPATQSELDASITGHTHAGEAIVSGTVDEPRVDAEIARDAEILPAVLAGDGSGSGLDADTLDGLELAEIQSYVPDNLVENSSFERFSAGDDEYPDSWTHLAGEAEGLTLVSKATPGTHGTSAVDVADMSVSVRFCLKQDVYAPGELPGEMAETDVHLSAWYRKTETSGLAVGVLGVDDGVSQSEVGLADSTTWSRADVGHVLAPGADRLVVETCPTGANGAEAGTYQFDAVMLTVGGADPDYRPHLADQLGAAGGDLSGSYPAPEVVDDSHLHSTASIGAEITRDSEILPTVLAGDGSGSGLDADTLDGLELAEIQSYVPDNLAENSSFERWLGDVPDAWNASGVSDVNTISEESGDPYHSATAMRLVDGTTEHLYVTQTLLDPVPADLSGKEIVVSVWVKQLDTTRPGGLLGLQVSAGDSPPALQTVLPSGPGADVWQRATLTHTIAPSDDRLGLWLAPNVHSADTGSYDFDAVMAVIGGDPAVEYRPSLLDMLAVAEKIYVSGDIGVGTLDPAEKLEVVGNVKATEFIGSGAGLTSVTASDLAGGAVVSESELDFDPATQAELGAHVGLPEAHHTIPTTLPPSGTAGGDLSGSYPNPDVVDDSHTHTSATIASELALDEEAGVIALCASSIASEGRRYLDLGDGTVLDCKTKLMWLKDANCIGHHYPEYDADGWSDNRVTWPHAQSFVAGINAGTYPDCEGGGHTDWRLPEIDELCSAFSYGANCPASAATDSLVDTTVSGEPKVSNALGDGGWTEGDPFDGVVASIYFAATEYEPDPAKVWCTVLNTGFIGTVNKTGQNYVWAVREPPEIFGLASQADLASHEGDQDGHREHGSLEESAEIDGDIAAHAAFPNAHHVPTEDTTCNGAACDGTSFTHLQWSALEGVPGGFADGTDDVGDPEETALLQEIRDELCRLYDLTGSAPEPDFCARIVFTTSAQYTGNLGGLQGADEKCQAHAEAGGLRGVFKAWLSDGSTSAASRLTHSVLPYVLVDGTVVADDWADLVDCTNPDCLQHAIDLDELGNPIPVATEANKIWSNTTSTGAGKGSSYSCSNWTVSTSGFGEFGENTRTDVRWTDRPEAGVSCPSSVRLYCFEQ